MKKEITLSIIIAIIVSAGTNIGIDQFKPDEFFCKARLEIGSYPCESFSKYYGLSNGKCLNSETGNKLCRTGWVKIINEIEETEEMIKLISSEAKRYICNPEGCKTSKN